MKTARKIFFWLFMAGLVLLMAVAVSFWAFQQIEDSVAARRHSYLQRSSVQELLMQLIDAESQQRGYEITSDETFLRSYTAAQSSIREHLVTLKAIAVSEPSELQLALAGSLIEAQLKEMSKLVAFTRNKDTKSAAAWVHGAVSLDHMDSIRAELGKFIQLEYLALAQHDAGLESNLHRLFVILVTGSTLALMSSLVFAYLVHQKFIQKFKYEAHLKTEELLAQQQDLNHQLHTTNQALAEGKEKLSVMLESMGDAVIATDANAYVTLLNPVAERLTGWSQDQAIGMKIDHIFRIINTDTRLPIATPVMATLARGNNQNLANHTTLIRRNGQECNVSDSCAPIKGNDDQVIGAILVFRDVTKEHDAQRALDAQNIKLENQNDQLRQSQMALDISRARYFDLYDKAPVGYCTLNKNGLIQEANLTTSNMLGTYTDVLVGQNIAHFIPEDELTCFENIFQNVIHTGQPQSCEIYMLRSCGEKLWVHMTTTLSHENRMPIVRVVINDVSDRKRAEESLVKANALQIAMFSSPNFCCMATDIHGVIQMFNIGVERMLGYSAEEVINKLTPTDLTDPADTLVRATKLSAELNTDIKPGFEAMVFKASRNIEDSCQLNYIRKDGSQFPVLISVTALRGTSDVIIGYLLICIDDAEHKRIEAEREQTEQMLLRKNIELENARTEAEKANLAKSDFISSMSHELRTPLGAILGFAQLIDSGTPALTQTQKRSIDQILKAGWYLLELINKILDLAKIESGQLTLSMEPVLLSEILNECEEMVWPQAQKYAITLHFEQLAIAYRVYADRVRAKQVLINLLSNAIKYNHPGGTVTVWCSSPTAEIIRINVQDTGDGLAPDMLAQLFQPFNRLGQENKIQDGTGIGLVVSKQLMELMHGKIGVSSTVQKGSIFWFELSLTSAILDTTSNTNQIATEIPKLRHDSSLKTLLYVEDNSANRMLVEDIIGRRADIRLLCATDGNAGVNLARTLLPDVILMDINLPGISGLTALRILAGDPTTAHIPVIALSANAILRDIEKGLEAGFFLYLTKPLKIDEFTLALNRALEFSELHSRDSDVRKEATK